MTLNSFSATWRLDVIQFTKDASNLTTGTIPDARISDTLTADKAYRRGNILGAVSQSAGVPTGALIEYDSNANGEYLRLPDGTQICTKSVAINTAINSAWGNIFLSASQSMGAFAASFSVVPQVWALIAPVGASAWTIQDGSTTTSNFPSIRLLRGPSQSATDYSATLLAIGRWF